MKKFITIITVSLFILICVCSLTGCNEDAKTTEDKKVTPATESVTEAPAEPSYDFPQLDEDDVLSQYTKDVKKRYSETGYSYFSFTNDEMNCYASAENYYIRSGYIQMWDIGSLEDYYNPILYLESDKPILVFTDEYGNVQSKGLYDVGWAYYGRLHRPVGLSKEYKSISSDVTREIVLTDSQVIVYSLGEIVASYDIPEGAIYCGRSELEGYIFRIEDEVYALRNKYFSGYEDFLDFKLEKLAEKVKFVILADYDVTQDTKIPLFQMEDGSLKAYYSEGGNKYDPSDPGHLVDISEGGGYYVF